jgi:DNA-binding MarR family transcriptional regulator
VNAVRGPVVAISTNGTRRDNVEDELVLAVLDVVERDTHDTQRHVASELGIALGLANAYLKRCVRKGLIKVSQVPRRRYAYYLTPQGFSEKSRLTATYLAHSLSFFRRARAQCGDIFAAAGSRGQTRLALVGPGDLAEIASLVAREYPVTIVGVIDPSEQPEHLRATASALGGVDAVVVTALEHPREVYTASLAAFGPACVHAPVLLRVHPQPASVEPVQ